MERQAPAVVVVAYGAEGLLREALAAVAGLDLVVVDNLGTAAARIVAEAHGARYVCPGSNVGFARAVNLGLQAVGRDRDVLLLNPDARISTAAVLELQQSLSARIAAVAPRLHRPSGGGTEPTSWPMPRPTSPWRDLVGRGGLRSGDECFLSGAVLLLSGQALGQVGGFDERYFLYAEEADWQKQAITSGWQVLEVGSVRAEHVGAATSTDPEVRARHFHGSAERFVRKWYGRPGWWVFRVGSVLAAARRGLFTANGARRSDAKRTIRLYLVGPARASSRVLR